MPFHVPLKVLRWKEMWSFASVLLSVGVDGTDLDGPGLRFDRGQGHPTRQVLGSQEVLRVTKTTGCIWQSPSEKLGGGGEKEEREHQRQAGSLPFIRGPECHVFICLLYWQPTGKHSV